MRRAGPGPEQCGWFNSESIFFFRDAETQLFSEHGVSGQSMVPDSAFSPSDRTADLKTFSGDEEVQKLC